LQLVVYACCYGAKANLLTQVDICCFDKTGTLTSDNMVLEGLTGLPGREEELVMDMKQAGEEVVRVLASCQALIQVDGKFVGDPLEKASFTAVGKPHKHQHKCELLLIGLPLGKELVHLSYWVAQQAGGWLANLSQLLDILTVIT